MIGNIYKNGVIVGDSKNLSASINSIIETCKFFDFNVADYEIKDFDDNVVWSGRKYKWMNEIFDNGNNNSND